MISIPILIVLAWCVIALALVLPQRIGTASLLCGYHQFILHPLFVAWGWWKLYGFPWDPRLWMAFFVHDWGYWGKRDMNGPEGERHPFRGAEIMGTLFDRGQPGRWFHFTLCHSRHTAEQLGLGYSALCCADKYAIVLYPIWLQIFLGSATGEINEYMAHKPGRPAMTCGDGMTKRQWVMKIQAKVAEWFRQNEPELAAKHFNTAHGLPLAQYSARKGGINEPPTGQRPPPPAPQRY